MYDLETRNCIGCGHPFRVLATSPQRYHSAKCEHDSNGGAGWAVPKKVLQGERNINAKKHDASIAKTLLSEKESSHVSASTPLETEKKKVKEVKNTTTPTKRQLMPKELSENEETQKRQTLTRETTIVKTEERSSKRSLLPEERDSRTEVYTKPLESLKTDHLSTMSLLDSSMRQLKTVLDSAATEHDGNPVRKLGSIAIDDICKVANTISVMAKVKVDAVRAFTDVVRATDEK